jgi:hypothetical protein
MAPALQQIRLACRHSLKRIAGANLRNGALVAIHAPVMAYLQKQRAIPKSVAALDAFGATNA